MVMWCVRFSVNVSGHCEHAAVDDVLAQVYLLVQMILMCIIAQKTHHSTDPYHQAVPSSDFTHRNFTV